MEEEKLTPVRLFILVLLYLAALFVLALLVFRLVVFRPDGPASTVDRPTDRTPPPKGSHLSPPRGDDESATDGYTVAAEFKARPASAATGSADFGEIREGLNVLYKTPQGDKFISVCLMR